MMTIEILNYNRRGKSYEQELLPYVTTEAGTFNQAMMELGALICTPKIHYAYFVQFKKTVRHLIKDI